MTHIVKRLLLLLSFKGKSNKKLNKHRNQSSEVNQFYLTKTYNLSSFTNDYKNNNYNEIIPFFFNCELTTELTLFYYFVLNTKNINKIENRWNRREENTIVTKNFFLYILWNTSKNKIITEQNNNIKNRIYKILPTATSESLQHLYCKIPTT